MSLTACLSLSEVLLLYNAKLMCNCITCWQGNFKELTLKDLDKYVVKDPRLPMLLEKYAPSHCDPLTGIYTDHNPPFADSREVELPLS